MRRNWMQFPSATYQALRVSQHKRAERLRRQIAISERNLAKECRSIINATLDLKMAQTELIRLGLIPDVRVKKSA